MLAKGCKLSNDALGHGLLKLGVFITNADTTKLKNAVEAYLSLTPDYPLTLK